MVGLPNFLKRNGKHTAGRSRYRPGKAPKPAKFHTRRRDKSWSQSWRQVRFFVLLIVLATVVAIYQTPGFYRPPTIFSSTPEPVQMTFTPCGRSGANACVADGDSIQIGDRRIRIVGIDAPEIYAKCEAEAKLARLAKAHLIEWLNRGPFDMTSRWDEPTDRYGRELMVLSRRLPNGEVEHIADVMQQAQLARSYSGGFRESWCD